MPGSNPTIRERLATVEAEVKHNTMGIKRLEGKMTDYHKALFEAIDGLRETAFTNKGAVKATCKIGGALVAVAALVLSAAKYQAFIKLWRSLFNGG